MVPVHWTTGLIELKNPTLLTGHVSDGLGLVDLHHSH